MSDDEYEGLGPLGPVDGAAELGHGVWTGHQSVVRRVGYGVHRFFTGVEPEVGGARYVMELVGDDDLWLLPKGSGFYSCSHDDWAWYRGGYGVLVWCLRDCLSGIWGDVSTVPTLTLGLAASSVEGLLIDAGVVARWAGGEAEYRASFDVDALDAWVASRLLQLSGSSDDDSPRHWARRLR